MRWLACSGSMGLGEQSGLLEEDQLFLANVVRSFLLRILLPSTLAVKNIFCGNNYIYF